MLNKPYTSEQPLPFKLCIKFESHSRRFGFSTRGIGHVKFWLAGTAQEADAKQHVTMACD